MTSIDFPPLDFSSRAREFNLYSDKQRAAVVYSWLVEGKTTRELDSLYLGKDGSESHGYQSMGILHYLGLGGKHQGIFRNISKIDMMLFLQSKAQDPAFCMIYYYLEDYLEDNGTLEALPMPSSDTFIYKEDELKGQTWVSSTLVKETAKKYPAKVDILLRDLPDRSHKIVIHNMTCNYSSREVKAAIKSLYDYKCQCCGDTIYRTGWSASLARQEQWLYMSADVHHIKPLSSGGPDLKDNMICLCPNCHRKFHSGQLRMIEKNNDIKVRDELFAKKEYPITRKHQIVLY